MWPNASFAMLRARQGATHEHALSIDGFLTSALTARLHQQLVRQRRFT